MKITRVEFEPRTSEFAPQSQSKPYQSNRGALRYWLLGQLFVPLPSDEGNNWNITLSIFPSYAMLQAEKIHNKQHITHTTHISLFNGKRPVCDLMPVLLKLFQSYFELYDCMVWRIMTDDLRPHFMFSPSVTSHKKILWITNTPMQIIHSIDEAIYPWTNILLGIHLKDLTWTIMWPF